MLFMEEKFQSILDNYNEQLSRHETEVTNLEARMSFCSDHKLEEEFRITRVKHDSLHMSVYRWRKMVTELEELLSKWNS